MIFSASPIDGLRALLTIRLNDSNFRIWSFQFKTVLEGQDLFGYCDGTSVCPPKYLSIHDEVMDEITVEYKTWKKTDKELLRLLLATISNETMEYLVGSKTIREAWKRLHDRYDRYPSIQPPRSASLNGENRVSSSLNPMSAMIAKASLSTAATLPGYGQYLSIVQNVLTAHQAFLSTDYGSRFRTIKIEQIPQQANKEKEENSSLENTETQMDHKSDTEDVSNSPHEAPVEAAIPSVIEKGSAVKLSSKASEIDKKKGAQNEVFSEHPTIRLDCASSLSVIQATLAMKLQRRKVLGDYNRGETERRSVYENDRREGSIEENILVKVEPKLILDINSIFYRCYSVLTDHLLWKIKHIAQPPGFKGMESAFQVSLLPWSSSVHLLLQCFQNQYCFADVAAAAS